MFKQPRRTLTTDKRISFEALHERICRRLDDDNLSEYLLKVSPHLREVPEAESREKYTSEFIRLCWDFLTAKEQKDLSSMLTPVTNSNSRCEFCKSDRFEYTSFERICKTCSSVITIIHNDNVYMCMRKASRKQYAIQKNNMKITHEYFINLYVFYCEH